MKLTTVAGRCAVVAVASLMASSAQAHSAEAEVGLMAGLVHPISGVDHLLAMLSVGIVSVLLGGANIWRVPAAFVGAMIAGSIVGFAEWAFPLAEFGIAWSVLLLGLAIAWPGAAGHPYAVFPCVCLFGFCHGYAHGAELPRAANALLFALGFLTTTIVVHACGIFLGELASGSSWRLRSLRALGFVAAGVGARFVLT